MNEEEEPCFVLDLKLFPLSQNDQKILCPGMLVVANKQIAIMIVEKLSRRRFKVLVEEKIYFAKITVSGKTIFLYESVEDLYNE